MSKALVPFAPFGFKNWPQCIKCGKPVDEVSYERMFVVSALRTGRPEHVLTGEIVFTIKCHGESYLISNTRGPLSPGPVHGYVQF